MIIKLLYPPSGLMPNRKNGKHWAATLELKDTARDVAYNITLDVLKGHKPTFGELIPLTITFVQADKRKRDLDNLLASEKSAIDGVALALKVDDSRFEPITIKRGYSKEACTLLEF